MTFPVSAPSGMRSVGVDTLVGKAGDGVVVWPVAGAYARIRVI